MLYPKVENPVRLFIFLRFAIFLGREIKRLVRQSSTPCASNPLLCSGQRTAKTQIGFWSESNIIPIDIGLKRGLASGMLLRGRKTATMAERRTQRRAQRIRFRGHNVKDLRTASQSFSSYPSSRQKKLILIDQRRGLWLGLQSGCGLRSEQLLGLLQNRKCWKGLDGIESQ